MRRHGLHLLGGAAHVPLRVLVVDDHVPILQHVVRVLEREFTVAGRFNDAESLIDGWATARPDVIVLDISLPGCSGLVAASRLRAAGCMAPVVFLSVYEGHELVRAAWEAGGTGYVAKQHLAADLVPAIRAAAIGRRFVSDAVAH